MAKILAALGGNAGAVIAGGGMCAALALGAYVGFGGAAETPVTATAPKAQTAPAPQAAAPTPAKEAAAEETSAPAPTFDELRRETDGTTIIAGRAAPLSDVSILLDGQEVATAKADGTGGFAAIAILPPKETAQVVSLSAKSGEEETASLDEIILAPTPAAPAEDVTADTQTAAVETPNTAEQALAMAGDTPTAAAQGSDALPDTQTAQATAQTTAPQTPRQPVETAAAETQTTATEQATPEAETTTTTAQASQSVTPEPVETAALAPEQTPAPVAVLKSDAEGVQLLQAARPQAMTAIALDTIGYSDLGDVQLTGRAQADTAKVRVYLDNRSVISLPVGADGRWRGDLPDVDEGIYTLRVDEVSTSGAVSSRVETPFKRESAETLAQAAAGQDGPVKSVTVQAGATLWAIARDRYGDGTLYVRVFEANTDSIRNPDLIYPGQVFDLPN